MSEKKISKPEELGGMSRREFLKDAGLALGGATLGSTALLNACSSPSQNTITKTSTVTVTSTSQAPPLQSAKPISFKVNGNKYTFTDLANYWPLVWVIREKLGLFGTKTGCNRGECGSCTILMNGKAVYSCMVLAVEADGAEITTVEGLSDGINFTGVQKAFFDNDALQCGYCTPGFIMAATALLAEKPKPSLDDIREALSGHQCTCCNHKTYIDALLKV
jgi:aerobic-type carbon monoxide dehydrogenase small subunit (CoxS/CutS family)